MAAAQSWEAAFPPEVATILGADAQLQLAIVEHKVSMPGLGYPSQCDIFALTCGDGIDQAVAIEAKVDEPFGPTLKEWLGPEPSANKLQRLNTICDWFGRSNPPTHLRYQLFHRTAAAIVEARRFHRPMAVMIVQSFSPSRKWNDDFRAFAQWLTDGPVDTDIVDLTLPDGLHLRLAWAAGDPRFLEDLNT